MTSPTRSPLKPRRYAHAFVALALVLLGLLGAGPVHAQAPAPLQLRVDSLVSRADSLQKRIGTLEAQVYQPLVPESAEAGGATSPFLGIRGDLAFTPPAADLLAANLSLGEKGTVTSVSVAPLRVMVPSQPLLYGVTASASYNTGTEVTSLGAGYVFRPRWLFRPANSRIDGRAHQNAVTEVDSASIPACVGIANPNTVPECRVALINAQRRLHEEFYDLSWFGLLPSPSVRHTRSFFAPNSTVPDQEVLANTTTTLALEWRAGVYAQADATLSWVRERASSVADTEMARTLAYGGTVVGLFPWLLGTQAYDDHYLENRFQRGIGIGVTYSVKDCRSEDELCPNGVLRDRLLGFVLDLRVTSALTPRFIIGRRHFERLDEDEVAPQIGFQLAFSISKSG